MISFLKAMSKLSQLFDYLELVFRQRPALSAMLCRNSGNTERTGGPGLPPPRNGPGAAQQQGDSSTAPCKLRFQNTLS
jgi:hypothetical protein